MADDVEVIWGFKTRQGGCRLVLSVPRERATDLRTELWGCAVVADTFEEFINLAARAIRHAGGILGDVLRQPAPDPPLGLSVRAAAASPDVTRARDWLISAFEHASAADVTKFLTDPADDDGRKYLSSVANALDDGAEAFVASLAEASGRSFEEFAEALRH